MRVLDHHDGRVDHRADGDGDAAQAHQVGIHAQEAHGDEGDQDADRQHQDGDQCAAQVEQEDDADQGDDQGFFEQRDLERVDGLVDQFGAVIHRFNRHPRGQARRDLGDFRLEVVDDLERVLTVARHGDA